MPRNYRPKQIERLLPHNVYMQVIYIIKDYHRMRQERQNILFSTQSHDGQPRGSQTSDTTAAKAVKLAALADRIDGVDRAIHDTNALYADKVKRDDVEQFDALDAFADYGTFCYMLYNPAQETQPAYRTWNRFKSAFAYKVAENLKII